MIAYRRWMHLTKAAELEQAHPAVRARELARGDDRRAMARSALGPASTPVTTGTTSGAGQTLNEQLDLVTVLKVSQDISTQLTGSGVVRAVLTGIAQNAGAESVILVLRDASGVEIVHGEVFKDSYRELHLPLDSYGDVARSVLRVVRRTGRPLVVADAISDPGRTPAIRS